MRPPPTPGPATPSCSPRPVRRSTSSATSSSVETSSGGLRRRWPVAVEAFPFEAVKTRARKRSPAVPVEYHLLLLLTLGLVAFGLIMVYSASSGTAVAQGGNPMGGLVREA